MDRSYWRDATWAVSLGCGAELVIFAVVMKAIDPHYSSISPVATLGSAVPGLVAWALLRRRPRSGMAAGALAASVIMLCLTGLFVVLGLAGGLP
jgi:hypothetical protein